MFDRDLLNRLYRYAYTLAGVEADAYDLLQDALERYLRRERGGLDNPEAYIRRIIHNCFIDGLRARGRSLEDSLDDPQSVARDMDFRTLESVMIDAEQLEWVWRQLDPRDREILFLWAVEGMSAREVAEQLGTPRGTVLSRIHRLRARLNALAETATNGELAAP